MLLAAQHTRSEHDIKVTVTELYKQDKKKIGDDISARKTKEETRLLGEH
jgi:hypothetical protein